MEKGVSVGFGVFFGFWVWFFLFFNSSTGSTVLCNSLKVLLLGLTNAQSALQTRIKFQVPILTTAST